VSRLFFENFFRPFSADFLSFRAIQKLHPQPISTGGNFMRAPVENRARFSRDEMKNLSRLSLIYERAPRRAARASDAFGCPASTHARAVLPS
jgi:hypothetical protein